MLEPIPEKNSRLSSPGPVHAPTRHLWTLERFSPLVDSIATLVGPDNAALFGGLVQATIENRELLDALSQTRRWKRYCSPKETMRAFADFETLGHTVFVLEIASVVLESAVKEGKVTPEDAAKVFSAMLMHDIPETVSDDTLFMLQSGSTDKLEIEIFKGKKADWWCKRLTHDELTDAETIFTSVFHGDPSNDVLSEIARGIDRTSYVLTAINVFEKRPSECEYEFMATSVLRNHGEKLLRLVTRHPCFLAALQPRTNALYALVNWVEAHPQEVRHYIFKDLIANQADLALRAMQTSDCLSWSFDLTGQVDPTPVDLKPWREILAILGQHSFPKLPPRPPL